MILDNCPDCGVALGQKHKDGCDVERCPHCGGQALGCVGFGRNDPRREPSTGKWPGGNDGRSGLPGARGRRCTDGQL
jgi:hypothetical protein